MKDKRCRHWIMFGSLLVIIFALLPHPAGAEKHALVFQTDFGLKDGAVSAMKGVSFGVDKDLSIFDLTHEIPVFNTWEAAYRLYQTVMYWPAGTVFVSVVDPGVGSERKSVVLKTKSGHFIVTPDNGTLTLVAEHLGIEAVSQIDEKVNRLPGSELSHTFHGRDVYAYTGARLAAGVITFDGVGPQLPKEVVSIPYQQAEFIDGKLCGTIPILDIQFGNVWTNIGNDLFQKMELSYGDQVGVTIYHGESVIYYGTMPFAHAFSEVPQGYPLVYLNSLLNVSVGLNQDSFAGKNGVNSGAEWKIELTK